MTLRDLLDDFESDLLISEGGYTRPFLIIKGLDDNVADSYSDVFRPAFLNRNVIGIKAVSKRRTAVCLEEV
jgi:hypothetical protein